MELVAPAGDWAMLKAAEKAGADAVYFGLKEWNMRHSAKNFSLPDLKRIGKLEIKKYLTLNSVLFDKDLYKINKILDKVKDNVNAVICWDMGLLGLLKKKEIPIHLSTQASVANSEALKFFKEQGVTRVTLARELNLEQIKKLKKYVEIGCFVHGAMCMAVSGRCFLSLDMFGMSANRGRCVQPCRRTYKLIDKETGKEIDVGRDYILSPKDVCALPFLDKLKAAGVSAFKIEGRSKNPEYVKTTVECYREALDNKLNENRINELIDRLKTVYNRGFSNGFYFGVPGINDFSNNYGSASVNKKKFIGVVENYYKKNKVAVVKILTGSLKIGDSILLTGNKTGVAEQKVRSMQINHKDTEKAAKGDIIGILMDSDVRENDMVYLVYRHHKA